MKTKPKTRPYAAYVVEGEGDKAFWTKVGAAFVHEDGEGFNLVLTAMPLSGRLVIRKPKDTEAGR
jgi:hypothetical protein